MILMRLLPAARVDMPGAALGTVLSTLLGAVLLSSALAWTPARAAGSDATSEFRLANGLRVIVREDRRAPTLVHQVWYRAGSMDEPVGASGVAHVLEHLMFKGTRKLKSGDFSRQVSEAGGRDNAFTNRDSTVYHQQVHRDHLELVMSLEAERMANLVVRADEFAREIQVVMEERRLRTEDRPRGLLYEALMASAWSSHPYRWPVIGWMADLQAMTHKDALAWYQRWYAPNNATVVVVGDVDAARVFRLAERHYGRLKSRPLPALRANDEAPQRGLRRTEVRAPAEAHGVLMGWKVPALRRIDQADAPASPYALAVLASLLDGYDGARLRQVLVRERRLAVATSASYDPYPRGPAMLMLGATAAQGVGTAQLEAAMRAEVARVVTEGVPAAELERVKTQMVARDVFDRDSIFSQSIEIGRLENAGLSWRDADRILERIRGVDAEQVRAAARLLSDDQLTVGTLEALPLDAAAPRRPAASGALRH